jgi:hypothetical protein
MIPVAMAFQRLLQSDQTLRMPAKNIRHVALLLSFTGCRLPARVLSSTAEVDAMPSLSTILLAADGLVLQRFADGLGEEGDGEVWECMGSNLLYRSADIALPARVLS